MLNTHSRHSIFSLTMLLLLVLPGVVYAETAAGITPDKATRITDPVTLTVQSGSNYVRFDEDHLPAVITYTSVPFGTIPEALAMGDTIKAERVFADCSLVWKWTIREAETTQIVEIKAHENATIHVEPYTCQTTSSDTTATACGPFTWKGKTYTQSGNYADTTKNATGCDSIVTLYLTINQSTQSEETETACDSLYWNGEWRKATGDYTYKTTNAAGCDSTATLHLTIYHSVSVMLKDTAICETDDGYEYIWGDTTITKAGTYTRHFKTAYGCDSAVTQTVRFLAMTYGTATVTAYDSYTTNIGITYHRTMIGLWDYYTNAAGCDSVVTLNLYIRHLQVNDTIKRSVCESELPFKWYGKTYKESGLYTTDTIHGEAVNGVYMDTVHTVNLIVNKSYAVDTIADLCDTSFVWHGTTYKESGAYPFNGTTVAGCDSIVTLRLTLRKPTTGDTTATAYEPFVWHGTTYAESGTYTYQTTNVAGCDSIVTLHLTVSERPVYDTVTVYYCPKSGIEEHIDATSNPMLWYKPYDYEKPSKEWYMEGVVTGEKNDGANVNFLKAEQNLHEHYEGEEQLTPVTTIYWRYRERGASSQTEVVINRTQPQWVERGTISIEVQFQCGQRFYDSFTLGDMTEDMEQVSGDEQAIKRVENGQVVIIRNGAKYTILGTKIQ